MTTKKYMTRSEAVKGGHMFYTTGLLCKYGHDAPRSTSGGCCCECGRIRYHNLKNPNDQIPLTSKFPLNSCVDVGGATTTSIRMHELELMNQHTKDETSHYSQELLPSTQSTRDMAHEYGEGLYTDINIPVGEYHISEHCSQWHESARFVQNGVCVRCMYQSAKQINTRVKCPSLTTADIRKDTMSNERKVRDRGKASKMMGAIEREFITNTGVVSRRRRIRLQDGYTGPINNRVYQFDNNNRHITDGLGEE